MVRRASSPRFEAWWRRVESVGYCAHPIQLVGADISGGRHQVWTRCNNRRATVCPSCSDLYARDTWQLVHAGAAGGHHNVPIEVAARPQVFTTLTAPGYGAVHNATGTVCHLRPGGSGAKCRHGNTMHCNAIHAADDPVVGQPLCGDCYDYLGHVLFAWHLPELWRRFTIALRRAVATQLKAIGVSSKSVRVSFVKVVELQARAIPHIHALIRLDPPDDPATASGDHDNDGPAAACGGGEPRCIADHDGRWSSPITAGELAALIQHAARHVHIDAPADGSNNRNGNRNRYRNRNRNRNGDCGSDGARVVRFGTQIDSQPLTPETHTVTGDPVGAAISRLSPRRVAGYLAKYVTKSLHDFGITARRLSAEAIRDLEVSEHVRAILSTIAELAEHPGAAVAGIGRWLHTLGYRGHITTKSRHYSTTLGALRTTRATWTRQQVRQAITERNAPQPVDRATGTGRDTADVIDPDAVAWEFDQAGHTSAGDCVLVISAALRHITARITALTETRTRARTGRLWLAPPGAGDG
ncbi:replication initiator [Mycolicibacter heraklionensis]|nr:replication initiator [Mycolicibacter heraklionensis]